LFELSVPACELLPDCDCRLGVVSGRLIGHRVAGKVAPGRTQPPPRKESERRSAIGVEWMSTMEARQAVPPAYTEWVRRQLLAALENAA
ncbi:MAG: hypothetical protein KGL39_10565, partial [Patescibacteria group bacterium]|nr:hypothetical protein [Patescibacteria group bacterium]